MPAFVAIPASPDDLEAIARLQYEAFASDEAFQVIFPKGATEEAVQYAVAQMENDMNEDPTVMFMIAKEAMHGEIAAYAVWRFFPLRSHEQIEREMLTDKFPLPADANIEAGNKLIHISVRKRHELVAKHIGFGQPYAYLSALGTKPKYLKQGAGSLLVQRGCERADNFFLPAYLESTVRGKGVYTKQGFEEVDRLKIELSPWKKGADFSNVCMVRPAKAED